MKSEWTRRNLLKLLPAACAFPGLAGAARQLSGHDRPNILVLVFDSLSAHHMSTYGYRRRTTPNLSRFAARCTVFHNCYSGGNFTTPGTATLLTGNYPWTHRAFNHAGSVAEEFENRNLFSLLRSSSYETIAFSHNLLANVLLTQFEDHIDDHLHPGSFSTFYGSFADRLFPGDARVASMACDDFLFQRGRIPGSLFLSMADRIRLGITKRAVFSRESEEYPLGLPELFKFAFKLPQVIDGLIERLARTREPYLAYFHLLPPHEPYRPNREFWNLFSDGWVPRKKPPSPFGQGLTSSELHKFRRMYDAFLANADAEFGRLAGFLEQTGRLQNTIVVFTSDHGQLFERGIHGHVTETLYDNVVRVPLLISRPGSNQRIDIHEPVASIDVVPTLLSGANIDIPDWLPGEVLPPFRTNALSPERPVYSLEAKGNPKGRRLTRATISMRRGRYKLVRYTGYDKCPDLTELFDLENDPQERRPLDHPETERLLSQLSRDLRRADELYLDGSPGSSDLGRSAEAKPER